LENTRLIPADDYEAEGMAFMDEIGWFPKTPAKMCGGENWWHFLDWWREKGDTVYVVRNEWRQVTLVGQDMLQDLKDRLARERNKIIIDQGAHARP